MAVPPARVTFSNRQKPLVFELNKARFDFVAEKLIHVVLDELQGGKAWQRYSGAG
jgi:hypothetical protein